MSECQAVVVGDLHLNAFRFLSNFLEDPDDIVYKALDTAVSFAHENGIDNFIILGDIWDHPNPTQDSQKRFLHYLKRTGLQCFLIMGNHDSTSEGDHSLVMSEFFAEEASSNTHIYTKSTLVTIDGVDFCFMPWPASKTLLKGPGINIAHITLKGAAGDNGRPLTKGEVIKNRPNQHWLIGDLHTRQKSGQVHYIGMMYQKTFGESLPKGFCHLTVEVKNGKLTVDDDFIITKPPYELVNLIIETADDLEKIVAYNRDDIKLYKLKLRGEVVLPPTLRTDYPNIYDVDYGKTRRVVEKEGKRISLKGVASPLKGLKAFLEKEGLSKSEINQALRYSKDILKSLEGKEHV